VVLLHLRNLLWRLLPLDGLSEGEDRGGWCSGERIRIDADTAERIRRVGVEHYGRRCST